jgi:Cdc6-like AAA superfamily ATPase
MKWIVIGHDKGRVKLVSAGQNQGILPKGSFLTIESDDPTEKAKFIARVDNSDQDFPYAPAPMIVDMGLSPLKQDQKCQNLVHAFIVRDLYQRTDGLINYIKPLMPARRSNQQEIDLAFGLDSLSTEESIGPKVFVAAVHGIQNQILTDEEGHYLTANLPSDMYFHQMMVCGKTGSGKTVCTKYLAQHFIEELDGAVLAINVKDVDFLQMDKPSNAVSPEVEKEWACIGENARGVDNFIAYFPANTPRSKIKAIDPDKYRAISLDVKTIDPSALIGIVQGISDAGARFLPDIFRYWQEDVAPERERQMPNSFTFASFVQYFGDGRESRMYRAKNSRGDLIETQLFPSTITNVLQNITNAIIFFDDRNAKCLTEDDILQRGLMTVIDLENEQAKNFGAILLRHLLHKIVEKKSANLSSVPTLIIIDEVHQFYNTQSSKDALGDLDTICRQGRSQKIGVIFSSQTPSDIPSGLSNVINTKIFFKSDTHSAKSHGVSITENEMEALKKGYAVGSIHGLTQLKIMKFPLSFSGVVLP